MHSGGSSPTSMLELVSQRELHYTWLRDRPGILSQRRRIGESAVESDGCRVEANRIRQVISIGAEAQNLTFGDVKVLVKSEIDTKKSGAAEIVARSGLARIRQAEELIGESDRVGSQIEGEGIAVRIEK